VKPEHEEAHRQDAITQYDKFVMSGSPLRESFGYRQTNFGHGNECTECNNAIILDMEKTRDDHFKDGLSEK
jgi:hypothetical protein